MKLSRWQAAAVVLAVIGVVVGKELYRDASAGGLSVFLAPTARLVGWITGRSFEYEAGTGWIDRGGTFIISPACAGVNFALAAWLALMIARSAAVHGGRTLVEAAIVSAAIAYVATVVVNTVRVAIAVGLHHADLGAMDRGEVHRMEGIVVYLGGLVALYAIAARRREHVCA